MPKLDETTKLAAIAAVGQGNVPQIRLVINDLYERVAALEEGAVHTHEDSSKFTDLKPAVGLTDDAKTPEVREAVIDLIERFNEVVDSLKGTTNG